jgi:hypothetical protein
MRATGELVLARVLRSAGYVVRLRDFVEVDDHSIVDSGADSGRYAKIYRNIFVIVGVFPEA